MNKRTIYLTLFGFLLLVFPKVSGQDNKASDNNQERIKALKVAFFTEQLELTSSEATKFWPMYNAYESEKEEIMTLKRREVFDKIGSLGKYSESEAKSILKRFRELEEREEALDQKFQSNMAGTFSATRTLKLFRAEYEFRKRLLREYRKKNGNIPTP